MQTITSKDNELIKHIRKLKDKNIVMKVMNMLLKV